MMCVWVCVCVCVAQTLRETPRVFVRSMSAATNTDTGFSTTDTNTGLALWTSMTNDWGNMHTTRCVHETSNAKHCMTPFFNRTTPSKLVRRELMWLNDIGNTR
jgi:hypothetical protein